MLQRPLSAVIPLSAMETILETFPQLYTQYYHEQMLHKLGFAQLSGLETEELIDLESSIVIFNQSWLSPVFLRPQTTIFSSLARGC